MRSVLPAVAAAVGLSSTFALGCMHAGALSPEQRAAHDWRASPIAKLCGNGRVDDGEVCDTGVEWERECPQGWGMCWECSPGCQSWSRLYVQPLNHQAVFGGFGPSRGRLDQELPPCVGRWVRGERPRYTYDEGGHLLRRESPGGSTDVWTWDEHGRPTSATRERPGLGRQDHPGHLALPVNRKLLSDTGGRRVEYVHGWDAPAEQRFDAHGRLVFELGHAGETVWWSYGSNEVTLRSYDRDGRTRSRVRMTYEGGQLAAKSSLLVDTTYQYDARGRLIREVRNRRDRDESLVSTWTWGPHGLVHRQIGGDESTFVYDDVGLLLVADDDLVGGRPYGYAYDADGRLVYAHKRQTQTYRWDDDGRLMESNTRHGHFVWEYDADGYPTQTTYASMPGVVRDDFRCHAERFASMPRRGFAELPSDDAQRKACEENLHPTMVCARSVSPQPPRDPEVSWWDRRPSSSVTSRPGRAGEAAASSRSRQAL